jgi:hypothetical protein
LLVGDAVIASAAAQPPANAISRHTDALPTSSLE